MEHKVKTKKWETLGEYPLKKDSIINIRLEEKKASNANELSTYKGSAIFLISIPRIAFTLEDIGTRRNWVAGISEHALIEKNVDSLEYTTYEHYDMVWPVRDREYIVHQQWIIDKNEDIPTISLLASSIESNAYPIRNDRVRGDLIRLYYKLKYLGPSETKIEVEIQVNPKGELPLFFIELIQKNWPVNTLKALYKEAEKKGPEHLQIKRLLNL